MCEQANALELATAFRFYSLVIAQTSHLMTRILRRVLFFVAFTAYLLVQVMLVGMIPAYYWPQSHWLHSVPSRASLKRRMWIHRPPTNHERALQPHRGGKMAHAPDTPAHRLHQADQGSETLGDLDSNRDREKSRSCSSPKRGLLCRTFPTRVPAGY